MHRSAVNAVTVCIEAVTYTDTVECHIDVAVSGAGNTLEFARMALKCGSRVLCSGEFCKGRKAGKDEMMLTTRQRWLCKSNCVR